MPFLLSKSLSSKIGFGFLVLLLWSGAFAISFKDAIPAIRASYAILNSENFWDPSKNLEESISRQRQIQAHYLSYGVYIPLDDIVIGAHVSNTQPLMKSIEGVCGPGVTAIWVPVPFHFPIFGEKVFEWCLVRT
jgi:hypothetical protein